MNTTGTKTHHDLEIIVIIGIILVLAVLTIHAANDKKAHAREVCLERTCERINDALNEIDVLKGCRASYTSIKKIETAIIKPGEHIPSELILKQNRLQIPQNH